jgi:hypothetical protein
VKEEFVDIFIAFNGKLVGSKQMQASVCEVVSWLPENMITFLTKKCWFLSSLDDAWAFTFTGNDLKDQHLIFLSDELLSQNPSQIKLSILHEIGHVILEHRNSVLEKQSKQEIEKQEQEADHFVEKYFKSV